MGLYAKNTHKKRKNKNKTKKKHKQKNIETSAFKSIIRRVDLASSAFLCRLQNSRIFCVGPSHKCARASNERSGATVKKTESGTGERRSSRRVTRFVRHTFPRHASISQGQHDRKTREKETALQYSPKLKSSEIFCK